MVHGLTCGSDKGSSHTHAPLVLFRESKHEKTTRLLAPNPLPNPGPGPDPLPKAPP